MPTVSTDDQARRLRYIYLGPVGWRFPFDARFPAIGLALFLIAVLSLGSFAFTPPGTKLGLLGALLSPIPAVLIARAVMRHVDHDRPLRWWVSTIQSELHAPRPIDSTDEYLITPSASIFQQGTPYAPRPLPSHAAPGRRRAAR